MTRGVLYVTGVAYLGGAELSLLELMGALDRNRFVPSLVTGSDGAPAARARALGIPVHVHAFPRLSRRRPWEYVASVLQLARMIKQNRTTLVHTNGPGYLTHVQHACRWARTPYVSHVRDLRHAWFGTRTSAALQRAECVIANSQAIAAEFVGAGISENRICVVYNPVDVDRFAQGPVGSGAELRSSLGVPSDACLVGIVGQVQEIKGHEDLVRAAPAVLSAIPEAHFLVAGAAFTDETLAFEARVVRLVDELGLGPRFHFLGFRDDVPTVIKALDLLVVPSWSEPFGRVVVEGLASGIPVIGTNAGGIPEIITNGEDGLLVPSRDADALAQAIVRLGKDPELCVRLSAVGQQTARGFSVSRHVAEIQGIYDSVLAHHGGGR